MMTQSDSISEMNGKWHPYDGREIMRGDIVRAKVFNGEQPHVVDVLRYHRNGIWWVQYEDKSMHKYELQVDKESITEILINEYYYLRRTQRAAERRKNRQTN